MSTYYFQLGNTPALSVLELELVLRQSVWADQLKTNPKLVLPEVAQISLDQELDQDDLTKLQTDLGGTVKVLEEVAVLHTQDQAEIESRIITYLAQADKRIQFSLTAIGDHPLPKLDEAVIKKELSALGVKSRYRPAPSDGLSAAVLLNHDVSELYLIKTDRYLVLAKTQAVQNIDDWTRRDREKPYANRKKGMLPPKVARMMVNIALGFLTQDPLYQSKIPAEITVYDPFCGTGTILMEAVMKGVQAQGTDLDDEAVSGATANLSWLAETYQLKADFSVTQRNVGQDFPANTPRWAEAIVTEPFLGKPTPQETELPNIFRGLHNMYLGAFKNWTKILQPNAVVVIILPRVETERHQFTLHKLIDKLAPLGYTTISEPVNYHRPQAIVEREIHFLRYQPK